MLHKYANKRSIYSCPNLLVNPFICTPSRLIHVYENANCLHKNHSNKLLINIGFTCRWSDRTGSYDVIVPFLSEASLSPLLGYFGYGTQLPSISTCLQHRRASTDTLLPSVETISEGNFGFGLAQFVSVPIADMCHTSEIRDSWWYVACSNKKFFKFVE